jgi:3-(3-hydroxy-phenyl)propionate hydroxylase
MSANPSKPASGFDVIIVGYGPSGATLANLLCRRGLRVAIIERALEIYDKPRAITADHEAMRVFQECGLAGTIEPKTVPHPGTDYLGLDGQVIKRFYPQPPPNPLTWEPTFMFFQPELEKDLRDGVGRFESAATYLGHEFIELQQDEHEVRVIAQRLSDSSKVSLTGRYLVACDGGRSPVREHVGATLEDLAFDEWWIVLDAWLKSDTELPPRCVQFCRPSRPGTYIVGPRNLRRWEIKMLPGETPEHFQSEESIRRVWSEFVDTSCLEVLRTAIYRFHALVAEKWRFGRVFLMGDAAHQMPPFMGQGLGAGVRDAVNLAWKLDAVLRRGASQDLLDSYGDERKPHVRTVVGHAKSFGLIIGELDEEAARRRDRRLEQEIASGKAETVRQKFIPDLTSGLISVGKTSQPKLGAGAIFPQPWVLDSAGADRRLDDLLPREFLVVGSGEETLTWLNEESKMSLAALNGAVAVISDGRRPRRSAADNVFDERGSVFGDWMKSINAQAVLVRPDKYVYGAAASPGELNELLKELRNAIFAQHLPASADKPCSPALSVSE